MSLHFLQGVIINWKWFYNSGVSIIVFNSVYLIVIAFNNVYLI